MSPAPHDRLHEPDANACAEPTEPSRRRLLQSAAAAAALGAAPHLRAQNAPEATPAADTSTPPAVPAQPVRLDINGREHALHIEPRVTLLDALRDYAGLTGTKKGCDRGQCGACTVLVEGRRINACLTLAVMHEGLLDTRTGRFANGNFAKYHVPVNADIGDLDVLFVGPPDLHFNPLGVRDIGEIGITGVPATIANAVYHATGVRVRDLPITLDKVMLPPHAMA